jgi:hypothetical protein
MKKLPIGIQTYKEIINGNYLYIDKTQHAFNLIDNYKYAFLSRPRRFGKSLFLDTLDEIFSGNKKLFKNTYIYDKWDWEDKYPVVRISFSGSNNVKELLNNINNNIDNNYNKHNLNINLKSDDYAVKFNKLIKEIKNLYNKNVVILIDEYDKGILDVIDNTEEATKCKDILKRFYTQIKDNDQYIKFCFLTGVSKFSKVSIFSGLNNLEDISLTPKFGDICGYTQYDIETTFKEHLKSVDFKKLKKRYNGYNFLGERVYNPFDILLFIRNDFNYRNYWFETGTPTFLIDCIKKQKKFLPHIKNRLAESKTLNSFDIKNINIESLLFQTGYLTIKDLIKKRDKEFYTLEFPNFEVKQSFNDYLLNYYTESGSNELVVDNLFEVFETSNLESLKETIQQIFASIAYNNFTKNEIANYEGFYASVFYTYLSALGFDLIPEDVTNKGRIDLTLKTDNITFLFEFKTNNEDPLKQIKEKKYYEKYTGDIYIIGINFNIEDKNVEQVVWEKI